MGVSVCKGDMASSKQMKVADQLGQGDSPSRVLLGVLSNISAGGTKTPLQASLGASSRLMKSALAFSFARSIRATLCRL